MSDVDAAPEPTSDARLILDPEERRVLGVLIEKGLTQPQSYPMSLNGIVTGCNQKSNRDPIANYNDADVEEILERLQKRELVGHFYPGEGGRVHRWRQDLGKTYEFRGIELAVIGELLLRGAQSEGELRQRASRMRPIDSLEALEEIVTKLIEHRPPFVIRLTPPGVRRGVRYTHACYEEGEMTQVLSDEASGGHASPSPSPRAVAPRSSEIEELKQRVDDLEKRLARIETALGGAERGAD